MNLVRSMIAGPLGHVRESMWESSGGLPGAPAPSGNSMMLRTCKGMPVQQ